MCEEAQDAAFGVSDEGLPHEKETGMNLITCLEDPDAVCKPELDKRTR